MAAAAAYVGQLTDSWIRINNLDKTPALGARSTRQLRFLAVGCVIVDD